MHIRIFHHSRRLAAAILGFLLTCAGLLTGIQAEPLGEWFIRNPLPQANTLSACAYGNGRWVALGTGGALVSSTDGEVWVAGSKPPEFTKESNGEGVPQINAMVYGGGQFVAVGMLGMVWTSPDGLNWTSRQSGDKAYTLTCIAYGNGIFVAGGHTNDTWGAYPLLSSTDGIHWENRAPINVSYETVAFGNGVFIVSGDGTAPWRSLNGKNWTPVSGAPTYPSGRVAFGADKFILYQRPKGYTDYTFSSKDGLSWIKTGTTGDSPGREFICPMIGTENGFVMAGIYNPTTLTSEIYTSPDGIIWTSHAFPNGSGIPLLCHGGGLIVAVGYGGEIHTSTNGQVWTSRMTESYHLNDVTYANGLYVAVGESYYRHWYNWSWNSTNGPAQSILTSPDGMNWTPRASLEGEHSSVAYGNGRFVTTGLSTFVDGLTWQLPPTNG